MALSDIDRSLLQRCLMRETKAWEDFVDRFLGLVLHVVRHTSQSRNVPLNQADCEDVVAEVFLTIIKNDFAVLRRFRGTSSLATYLTVVARRVAVRELLKRTKQQPPVSQTVSRASSSTNHADQKALAAVSDPAHPPEERIQNREEVEDLMSQLDDKEVQIVRLFHLEGKTYQEISEALGVPVNSIGPTLSRAREKMRTRAASS